LTDETERKRRSEKGEKQSKKGMNFSDKMGEKKTPHRSSYPTRQATFLLRHRRNHGGQRRNEELFLGQVVEQEKVLRGREWTKTRRVRNLGRVQKASVLVPERAAQGK
tara:strand:- start:173 stop:496 length:324 start_codon:yes stop_codon:yes gene_type:complete